ncbi:MAG: GIY-YIG nuclease family protein [bacterium]|nr:GIY-YIG nuclease family protein [bacterium]
MYFTYIITNKINTVLYTGVTNNLQRRMFEHKNKIISGFSSKYNLNKLVWYQEFNEINDALSAEKRVKGWTRQKKNNLIELLNPNWRDLSFGDPSLHSG